MENDPFLVRSFGSVHELYTASCGSAATRTDNRKANYSGGTSNASSARIASGELTESHPVVLLWAALGWGGGGSGTKQ
jgi:hypothetical protein